MATAAPQPLRGTEMAFVFDVWTIHYSITALHAMRRLDSCFKPCMHVHVSIYAGLFLKLLPQGVAGTGMPEKTGWKC